MSDNLQLELAKITQQPQRQDASLDQLQDLHAFANKLGLYDAADLIRNMTSHPQQAPRSDVQAGKDTGEPLNVGEEAAQFKAWFDPWWLKSSAPCKNIPTNADKHFLTYLNQYTPAFYAWLAAKNARHDLPRVPLCPPQESKPVAPPKAKSSSDLLDFLATQSLESIAGMMTAMQQRIAAMEGPLLGARPNTSGEGRPASSKPSPKM